MAVDVTWPSSTESLSLSVSPEMAYGQRPRVTVSLVKAHGTIDTSPGHVDFTYIPVPPQVTLTSGQRAEVPLAAGVTRARLEYTATGTYVASTPSSPGRGLVLLTPLQLTDAGVDLRLAVTDDRVLNVACRTAVLTRVCGTRSGSTWTVTDLAAGEDVIAQVDLVTTSWTHSRGELSVPAG